MGSDRFGSDFVLEDFGIQSSSQYSVLFPVGPERIKEGRITNPGQAVSTVLQPLERRIVQESQLDKRLDESRESLVPQSSPNDRSGLGNLVLLPEGRRITVGVRDERERGGDKVVVGVRHEVLARDLDERAVFVQASRVSEGEKNSTRRPGELVSERVVGGFGGREPSAVGEEGGNLERGGWEDK